MKRIRPSTTRRSGWLLAMALTLSGCTAMQKLVGMKTDLRDKPVSELRPSLSQSALCPGQVAALVVRVTLKDGQELVTEGAGGGKVTWDSFELDGVGLRVEEGVVMMHPDPRVARKHGRLMLRVVGQPQVSAELDVPARFDCAFVARFDGDSGRNGADGQTGRKGADGANEQSSPSVARPGGVGQVGGHGGNGDDGEAGRPGDEVEVAVALVSGEPKEKPLLQVKVRGAHKPNEQLFLVDPTGGSVLISANGGAGGNGGNGGSGGAGGSGGTGAPPGNGGDGGNGGNGGNGGDGGDGGRVTLTVSPDAQRFMSLIKVENRGGAGGQPGHAGPGGSGGGAFSGAQSGRSGHSGQGGRRAGRAGRDGPPPKVEVRPLVARP